MVKPECFHARFDEEWNIVMNYNSYKEQEVSVAKWGKLSKTCSFGYFLAFPPS